MKKRMVCGWFLAALAAWTLHAAAGQPRLTAIEVTSTPKTNVTVRGKGEAGTAYKLAWSAKLGDAADWQHAGDATAKDDGSFAILDEGFRKPGFYRVQGDSSPGRYLVVHMSSGVAEDGWPVTYLDSVPAGGWTDEYKTTNLVLRRIPAGTFVMGSPEGEKSRATNETPHRVTLTRDYYIGVFEITQAQWELVMKTNPSAHKGDTRPVDKVSYNDIRGSDRGANWPSDDKVDHDSFIGRLSTLTGLDFDLPTEAQWEYACRAGTTTALNNGRDLDAVSGTCTNLDSIGRYSGNRSDGKGGFAEHTVVGSYLPNAWGLYDMHGNVSEWCLDWFAPFSGDSAWNPVGPLEPASGYGRVKRGGSWSHPSGSCRSATRFTGSASEASLYAGLRLVCSGHRGVQLWKNGPYWAETNIGADNPEDFGLYFWWGDTVGYKWENGAWVASDGSVTNFSFCETNAPTYGKDSATLESEGWIRKYISELAPEHDAARAHWGGRWRMPTQEELDSLTCAITTTWTTSNGVYGRLLTGLDDYASASIFLPAAGYGGGTNFHANVNDSSTNNDQWSNGCYWSSREAYPPDASHGLIFDYYKIDWSHFSREAGLSVRPVLDAR
jgi:formylglycine-generating enzyme required for sulfatase activity